MVIWVIILGGGVLSSIRRRVMQGGGVVHGGQAGGWTIPFFAIVIIKFRQILIDAAFFGVDVDECCSFCRIAISIKVYMKPSDVPSNNDNNE